jgi:predicted RNA-binding Zn ribbon-like protein
MLETDNYVRYRYLMLALDLANTGASRDVLTTPAELASWLMGHEAVLGVASAEVALRLGDFRALRAAVRDAVLSLPAWSAPPPDAIRALNEASAAVPTALALEIVDGRPARSERGTAIPSRTVQILASIARSAIELVGGPDRERLRACPARGCGTMFLASRPRQVWCSASCGNRTRVARHHARAKAK